jgi:hypothetical protein
MQQHAARTHEHDVSERTRRSTHRQETSVQIRRYLATAFASGALITAGLGLALATPAAAAPTPAKPSPVATTPRAPAPLPSSSAAPTAVPSSAPAIEVPAGNAGPSSQASDGATSLEIGTLVAGLALAGGGTVLAFRRRA